MWTTSSRLHTGWPRGMFRLGRYGLVALSWTLLGSGAVLGQDVYFEQEVAATHDRRVAQAAEFGDYIRRLREDPSQLQGIFQPDFASIQSFVTSAEAYRRAFATSIGFPAPGVIPEEPARFERLGEDGIGTYFRAYIPVRPGLNTEGIYIVPKGAIGPAPLVIAQHGGAGSPELALFNGGSNYHDMVRGAVKRGFAVFAPQLLFSSPGLATENRRQTDRRLRQVGTSIVALEIAKIMRGIDVLSARPEIDPARIAMVGLSYGGFYTLVTTAMDPRIKVAVCSGYFGIQEGRYAKDDLSIASDLEFAGRFTRFRDPDLIALICPRPLQIQAGLDDDPLHRTAGEQFAPLAAAWYERLGLGALFEHRMFAGGHEFNDALAWAFVQNHLQEEAP